MLFPCIWGREKGEERGEEEKIDLQWKFPSPTWPTILPSSPDLLICSLVSSMICGNLLMGTATSVVHTPTSSLPSPLAITLHSASFRACHKSSFSCSLFANSKDTEPAFLAMPWTWLTCSFTLLGVPANLKNSVGAFFHVLAV